MRFQLGNLLGGVLVCVDILPYFTTNQIKLRSVCIPANSIFGRLFGVCISTSEALKIRNDEALDLYAKENISKSVFNGGCGKKEFSKESKWFWALSFQGVSTIPGPMDQVYRYMDWTKSKLMFTHQDKRCGLCLNSMYLSRYLLHPEHTGCCRRRCCYPYSIQILAAKCPENHASSHRVPSEALLAPEPFAQSAQKGAVLVAAEAGLRNHPSIQTMSGGKECIVILAFILDEFVLKMVATGWGGSDRWRLPTTILAFGRVNCSPSQKRSPAKNCWDMNFQITLNQK